MPDAVAPTRSFVEAMYIARSRNARYPSSQVEGLAARLGVEYIEDHPVPADRLGLLVSNAGYLLYVPGHPPQAWHPGMTVMRCRTPERDPLIRALGLLPGETVLDGTLGLGHDAWVVLSVGGRVIGVEANPLLALFTETGMRTVDPERCRGLRVITGRFEAHLTAPRAEVYDHVYLDPLFGGEGQASAGTWAPIRAVGRAGRFDLDGLLLAFDSARRQLVVKLAPGEAPPSLPGRPEPVIVSSKRLAFAVWAH